MESSLTKNYHLKISSVPIEKIYKNVEPMKFHRYPFVMVWKTDDEEYELCGHQTKEAVLDDYYQSQEEGNGWELVGVYQGTKPLILEVTTTVTLK